MMDIKTYNGLPLHRLILSDETEGIRFNSFVEDPAIDVVHNALWVAFSKEKQYKVELNVNKEKRIVTGPTMIPNIPIYRSNINGKPGYVYMTAEDIEKATIQFSDANYKTKNNIEHQQGTEINSTVEIEKWIIMDSNLDKAKALGFNLPVGTQMTSTYFKDEKLWNENVKTGKWKGYSIEGNFTLKQNKNKLNIMDNTKQVIKMALEVITTAGIKLIIDDEAPKVGSSVMVVDADGNESEAPDQSWDLENGWVIVTVGGKISEIIDPSVSAETEVEQTTEVEQSEDVMVKLNATLSDIVKRIEKMEASFTEVSQSVETMSVEVAQNKELISKLPGSKFGSSKSDTTFPGKKIELASQKISSINKKYEDMDVNEKAQFLRAKNSK